MSVQESKRVFVSVISADKSSEDGTRSESICLMNWVPTRMTTSSSVPPKTGPCGQNVSVNIRAGNGIGTTARLRRRLRQAAVLLHSLLLTAIFVAHTDASPRLNRPTFAMDATNAYPCQELTNA